MTQVVNGVQAGGQDRRPWLIISRREARALVDAVLDHPPRGRPSNDLRRALSIIGLQLDWIGGMHQQRGREPKGSIPSVLDTVER